jgi:hypothetical protein
MGSGPQAFALKILCATNPTACWPWLRRGSTNSERF